MTDHAGQHMTKKLITVNENESVEQALMIMKNHQFRHLPVINKKSGDIVGIVSDRDLYKGLSTDEVSVQQVMSHPVHQFDVTAPIKDIVEYMIKNKLSAFLLTQDSKIKGIITSEDLLIILSHMLSDESKERSFIDNYMEFSNQLTGAVFNPNLIF